MTALRILAFVALAMAWLAGCWYLGGLVNRWFALSPTTPDEPGDDDREASGEPVEHEGASVEWGAKLRDMRDMPPAPELVTDTENDLRWGLLWHAFEHDMQAEIDRVFAPYLAVPVADDFDELREQTCPRELVAA